MSDLFKLSLIEAQENLRQGNFTSLELTTCLLSRIDELDPVLHAFATRTPELALSQAREADKARARGEDLGWMQGIPLGLKDLCATEGTPTHAGSLACANWRPQIESTVAARLRKSGAVLLGKLTTTEGASGVHHPEITAPVNPWNSQHWVGASSSGSASATSAGLCMASLGSDTGGSIRFPSQCCGLVGLKPTWGLVSRHGVFPLAPSLDHVGPMARRVEDVAAVLSVIAGRDDLDPTTVHRSRLDYNSFLCDDLSQLRLGFDTRFCSEGVNSFVVGSIESAVGILREHRVKILPVSLPTTRNVHDAWLVQCGIEAAASHHETYPSKKSDYGPALVALLEWGNKRSYVEIVNSLLTRKALIQEWDRIFGNVDAVISPTTFDPVPTLEKGRSQMRGKDMRRLMHFTLQANLAGLPTVSIPGAIDSSGVPTGFQIIGRPFGEAELLKLGYAIQNESDWTSREIPPV